MKDGESRAGGFPIHHSSLSPTLLFSQDAVVLNYFHMFWYNMFSGTEEEMAGQHYCLRWNNYQSNMTSVFHHLLKTQAFVDVTLACNDQSLKAHKVRYIVIKCGKVLSLLFFFSVFIFVCQCL